MLQLPLQSRALEQVLAMDFLLGGQPDRSSFKEHLMPSPGIPLMLLLPVCCMKISNKTTGVLKVGNCKSAGLVVSPNLLRLLGVCSLPQKTCQRNPRLPGRSRPRDNVICVPEAFPVDNVTHWTLQDHPAVVNIHPDGYRVESDLLLANNHVLTCHVAVHDTATIHNRLIDLWSPRWNKHQDVPDCHWDQILGFARGHMQYEPFDLPPITSKDFRRVIGAFKSIAAAGPCGWYVDGLSKTLNTL